MKELKELKEEIMQVNNAFYRAFEKKDMEAMATIWSQGTGSVCIHPGWNILHGWNAIRDSWEKIFKNTNYIEINTEIISLEVRDEIAYMILIENIMQVATGKRIEAKSSATNIFEYMGGKWYLVSHHGSPILR